MNCRAMVAELSGRVFEQTTLLFGLLFIEKGGLDLIPGPVVYFPSLLENTRTGNRGAFFRLYHQPAQQPDHRRRHNYRWRRTPFLPLRTRF